mgnify:CR=1 FL=1
MVFIITAAELNIDFFKLFLRLMTSSRLLMLVNCSGRSIPGGYCSFDCACVFCCCGFAFLFETALSLFVACLFTAIWSSGLLGVLRSVCLFDFGLSCTERSTGFGFCFGEDFLDFAGFHHRCC